MEDDDDAPLVLPQHARSVLAAPQFHDNISSGVVAAPPLQSTTFGVAPLPLPVVAGLGAVTGAYSQVHSSKESSRQADAINEVRNTNHSDEEGWDAPLLSKRPNAPIRKKIRLPSDWEGSDSDDDRPLVAPPKARKASPPPQSKIPKAPAARKTKAAATPQSAPAAVRKKVERKPKAPKDDDLLMNGSTKKHFAKDGQKSACPPMGDGTRAFYESLLKENPNSIIAIKYCIEHGVLMGTQLKEVAKQYHIMKEVGAFKGTLGGIREEFAKGVKHDALDSFEGGGRAKRAKVMKTTNSPTPKKRAVSGK